MKAKYLLLILSAFLMFSLYSCVGGSGSKNEYALYVSPDGDDGNPGTFSKPLKTIQKAIDACALSEKNSIFLKEGTFHLEVPLLITPSHSENKDFLEITNYEGDRVIISGGREVTGWHKQENGWWVTEIPEVKEGSLKFRQLYVNEEWRQRARTPNTGHDTIKSYGESREQFEFAEGDLKGDWTNIEDAEVIVYQYWNDTHLPIKSIDDESNTVTFQHSARRFNISMKTDDPAIYIVENILEELDVPGEWYLDRKTGLCYYYPFPHEKIEESSIYIPMTEQLIRFEGDPENQKWVKNIRIENLDFRHTNFELPPGNPNHRQASYTVPAAVFMTGTQDCSISHCRFTNLGSYAVELSNGCSENTFMQNEISHVAAGGFKVNGGMYQDHYFLHTYNNNFLYNHIHHYGEVYSSAIGVLLMHTSGNKVSHNLIHNGYYTAISIGWDWGYQRGVGRDNIIEYNHLHTIGQGLISDMGAIYTLGVSPGSVFRNNLIHDVEAQNYGGLGIYHDQGSSDVLVENNIVYNCEHANFDIHFSKRILVRNNIFAYGKKGQIRRVESEPHKMVYFERNIVYWTEGELIVYSWEDFPYTFYRGPRREGQDSSTFDMDYNLYFNPDKAEAEVDYYGGSFTEWKEKGKDIHSIYSDPQFVDPENYDFRLKENSPAFALGFKPIDMTHVALDNKPVGPVY